MIQTFKQKELKKLYETGKSGKIKKQFQRRILQILTLLNAAKEAEDMNFPGSKFQQLSGDKNDYYSVSVNHNYRIMFKFKEGEAFDVELIDYH